MDGVRRRERVRGDGKEVDGDKISGDYQKVGRRLT